MAIAEHSPEKVKAENKGVLKMSKEQLSDFASTKTKGLPNKVKVSKKLPKAEPHPWRREWDHKA